MNNSQFFKVCKALFERSERKDRGLPNLLRKLEGFASLKFLRSGAGRGQNGDPKSKILYFSGAGTFRS